MKTAKKLSEFKIPNDEVDTASRKMSMELRLSEVSSKRKGFIFALITV